MNVKQNRLANRRRILRVNCCWSCLTRT